LLRSGGPRRALSIDVVIRESPREQIVASTVERRFIGIG